MRSQEDFKPFPNRVARGPTWRVSFFLQRVVNFQLLTIYLHMRDFLAQARGTVMDVGCGDCVYKNFLDPSVRYVGLDIDSAENFDYGKQSEIVRFDGNTIPFPDESVDNIICSEVLEHVSHPETLIGEMRRVMKPGAKAFVTIPWSARFHYIPHDYARYTPTKLRELFSAFTIDAIAPRGSDISVIGNKFIVFSARQVLCNGKIIYWKLPLILLLSPFLALALVWGLVSVAFNWGSTDDPLGYTIRVRKS